MQKNGPSISDNNYNLLQLRQLSTEAIKGVPSQIHKNIEILVIDDRSVDNSLEKLQQPQLHTDICSW